jgi:glutamate-1-semialdehyde 2,1-aminomutase
MPYAAAAPAELHTARQRFADRNPQSRLLHESAVTVLPGGNTRSLFYMQPFPLTFVSGRGSVLTDADGHDYIDLVGDYTAGLLGHSDERVRAAVFAALSTNTSVGGIHPAEQRLATLMCERWQLDLVRFTNSGTEANLMAITAARLFTGRSKVVAMEAGYHGGVLYFAMQPAPWTVPFPFEMGSFNDLDACRRAVDACGDDLAAVIVEPMMGGGGCIPPEPGFLGGLAEITRSAGGLLIADEVMTSRLGPHGLCHLQGVAPDLKTFGKYIGGGFSFGAFGGTAEVMAMFDARRPDAVSHAGTFNNNVASISAGVEVLGTLFTAADAEQLTARGEDLRANVATVVARHALPMCVTGFGSMMTIHARPAPPRTGGDGAHRDAVLQERLYLGLLDRGVYIAARGMVNLSLTVTDDQLAEFLDSLDEVCRELTVSTR